MVIRQYRALINAGRESEYFAAIHSLIREIRESTGLVSDHYGRRMRRDGRLEVMAVTVWRDWDSLTAWAPDPTRSRPIPLLDDVVEREWIVIWEAFEDGVFDDAIAEPSIGLARDDL